MARSATGTRAEPPPGSVTPWSHRDRHAQVYRRHGTHVYALANQYDYAAPAFGFTCRLIYDESGLVPDYPGIAVRAG